MKDTIIEIRDPEINVADINQRIRRQVTQRRTDDIYPVDLLQLGPSSLQSGRMDATGSSIGFPGLSESLLQLLDQSTLVEPVFTSNKPLVGFLIVAFRRAWNWMSTKWYVRPILQQQTTINAQLIELVGEITQWQELQAQEQEVLRTRLANLESRLEDAA